MNSFFLKNEMLLIAIWWPVVTYPSCCSKWSGTLTCVKAVECSFQIYRSCFKFTLIYCEGWRWCPSLHLLLAVFPNVFISQSLHWRCVSAFSISPVNATYSMISDSWFTFCFAYSVENGSQRNRFIDFESSIHGRPPWPGQTDSGRVLLCNPGRPHSNTNTMQILDNSITIVDEGPHSWRRINTDLLFLPFGWLAV